MIVKGRITANDIEYGVAGDPLNCPLHRSLARRKPFKGRSFLVRTYGVYDGTFVVAAHPEELKGWIRSFDMRENVAPVNYEIEIVDSWLNEA